MTPLEWQLAGGFCGLVLGVILIFVVGRIRDGYWW